MVNTHSSYVDSSAVSFARAIDYYFLRLSFRAAFIKTNSLLHVIVPCEQTQNPYFCHQGNCAWYFSAPRGENAPKFESLTGEG